MTLIRMVVYEKIAKGTSLTKKERCRILEALIEVVKRGLESEKF